MLAREVEIAFAVVIWNTWCDLNHVDTKSRVVSNGPSYLVPVSFLNLYPCSTSENTMLENCVLMRKKYLPQTHSIRFQSSFCQNPYIAQQQVCISDDINCNFLIFKTKQISVITTCSLKQTISIVFTSTLVRL